MRRALSLVVTLTVASGLSAVSASAAPARCSGGYVGLTFDDGPRPETNAILDALRANHLRATFFVVGANVQMYPDIARRIVLEGHDIANHSWDHSDMTQLPADQVDWQLRSTNLAILQAAGVMPRLFRPPYGSSNATLRRAIREHGLTEVMWSQDSYDWMGASSLDILNQLTVVPPGGTLLMHDGVPNTLAAIPSFAWYFNTYWTSAPICAGRLARTTNVQPVLRWLGEFFFVKASAW